MPSSPHPEPLDRSKPVLVSRPPPPFADKARRALWSLAYLTLFRPSPVPLPGWRRAVLRLFGARIGRGAALYPSCTIWAPWNLVAEDHATVGPGAVLYNVDRITLRESSIVSQRAHLCTGTHDHRSPDFTLMTAPIEVGAHAWIAADAFVGPGVAIGPGAVVAARGVAVRHVPQRAIVAGNPARQIGERPADARNLLAHGAALSRP